MRKLRFGITAIAVLLLIVAVLMLRANPVIPGSRSTILQKASERGVTWLVWLQLSVGADPNHQKRSPLINAVMFKHPHTAKVLIHHGADVNEQFGSGEVGGTPLVWALVDKQPETALYLIQHGTNANAHSVCCGYSVLCLAAQLGNPAVVQALVERRADVNASDNAGWTPLHHAIYNGNAEAASILLKAGADSFRKTTRAVDDGNRYVVPSGKRAINVHIPAGSTPFDIARIRGVSIHSKS